MKLLNSFLGAASLVSAHGPYRQNAIYLEKNLNPANRDALKNEFLQALEAGYNRFYTGFYMSQYGAQGASLEWSLLDADTRTEMKSMLAAYDATLYLSVGGPGEFWEHIIDATNPQGQTCQSFAQQAATFAHQYGYDGIELTMKLAGEGTIPSPYFDNGSFANCARTAISTMTGTGYFTNDQMTLSSNAPYFSIDYAKNNLQNSLSDLAVRSNVNQTWFVRDINLMMFNEDGNYVTYNDIFVENTFNDPIYGVFGKGSSVLEIVKNNIDPRYVAVIKPITASETSVRSGYVAPSTLGQWGCSAHNSYGFLGGFVGWTWNSSSEGEFNNVINFVQNTLPCE